ncbi:putative [Myosin heavy-chain] kinase transcription factor WD40-like family [Helianthus annuus]|uniref:Putative zinc ion binding protein n=1 Tax=Helianthus annuus TaxID=4232 RepID=A0A251VFX3_HELAN|nr:uncharacterized protein LOC110916698 [Helianthus annuus]KAF5818330.1 putative [Myosin heavy-chain] kinase transcription factor WD40-like family [Helianthus annuus]KAJ0604627.1 putative [Myosin heavy-chain] kinase transcription factor WD40-like family [Helianthus annuus]KAJ0615160.1 putative [Myosin heavy-chain] kinase transcription factor WD40-like family [Helianthus annuus]
METAECPVCLQEFSGEKTIPRVLGCGHSVCECCLVELPKPAAFPNTIRCPACTQLLPYTTPYALPKNIDLLRLLSPNPKPKPKPKPHPHPHPHPPAAADNLWPHDFFSHWKDWIAPDGKAVCSKASSSLKTNNLVSLFKIAHSENENENGSRFFNYSYLAKAMSILFQMGDGALAQLDLILTSTLMEHRICSASGLWYNSQDHSLYLACQRKQTTLFNSDIQPHISSTFAIIAMELCETLSGLHHAELVAGCTSSSCFGIDDFGHISIDLNQVLTIGRRLQEAVVSNDSLSSVISEINAFPSPELLIEFLRKEGTVDLEFPCTVGYSSDLWSLVCVLLWFLLGKPFVEETCDFLCNYLHKLVKGNVCDCEGLHVAWLDKVSSLLDSKLDSSYVLMKELLCKCLCHDPGTRPLVNDLWKCMRELIISPKYDVTLTKTTTGSTCHCLLLGDLLWSSNKVDDNKGMMNKTSVVRSDVIEGVCKNSLACTELKGHLDCISGLAIGGGFLFSSSFDKTINVWSLEGLNHVRTLKGHEHKVMALVFVEREVPLCISGDNGGVIFIWGIEDEKPIRRMNEEKDWRYSGIHALAAAVSGSDYFYTGSGDKSVKAWSMHDYSLSFTMNGHKSVVCTLAVCNGVLYSGSWDGTIRLWCLSDHSPLAVLGEEDTSTCGSVLSLAAHTHTLVAAHENGHIKVWNKDVPLNPPISAHSSSIFSICMEGQWLFSGGWNKSVVVQKLSLGDESQVDVTEVGSIAGDSVITALHYWQGRLFVGHADRTIKIYSSGG